MSEKALKIIIYIAGVACLYAFLAIRIQPLFNAIVREKIIPEYWENTKYGELYYFNFIRNFREEGLPPHAEKYRHTDRHPSIEEADILTFGDSFFDFTRYTTFPEQLGDQMDEKVYYERFDFPLNSLAEEKYKCRERKILIYESAERYIPLRFSSPHPVQPIVDNRGELRKSMANLRDWIFLGDTEAKYTMLLNRSYFTTDIYSGIATFKFNTFNYISSLTPKYSLAYEKPWLFYYEQLNDDPSSFYYQFTDDELDYIVENIVKLDRNLDEMYNLEMVFMPIPSKYTIYHTLLNNDPYNNFLIELYTRLEEKNIPVIKLLDEFQSSDETLYLGTDTHWNQKGIDIAIEETVCILETLREQNVLANETSHIKNLSNPKKQ